MHFKFPERIEIGDNVWINEYAVIDGDGGVELGDFSRIGNHVHIITHGFYYSDKNVPRKLQGKWTKKVVIGKDVGISSGAQIFPGVKIGDGATIGANSVVIEDVLPNAIVMTPPARVIGLRGIPSRTHSNDNNKLKR